MENKTYLAMMEKNPDLSLASIEMMYGLPEHTLKNIQRDAIKKMKFSIAARKRNYKQIIKQKMEEQERENRLRAKKKAGKV